MSILVGKKLSQARQDQGFTLEHVAEVTIIRLRYLEAMEAGKFDLLPSTVQARGFLRTYADFLKLDRQVLLDLLTQDPLSTVLAQRKEDESSDDLVIEGRSLAPEKKSDLNLVSVGESLRKRREILGISLEEIERHTHVKIHYLQAFEEGDFDSIPSMVQGSGMLKNYATFIGLDPEPLLLRFAESLQVRLAVRHPREEKKQTPNTDEKKSNRFRRILSRDALFGALVIIFLVGFSVLAGMQISAARLAEETVPTPPSIADVLLPSATASAVPTAAPTGFSPLEVVTGEAGALVLAATEIPVEGELLFGAVQVQIAVHQRAWVRVSIDGEVTFDQRVIPGSVYAFAADEQVEILTGNGAGLDVTYNGNRIGTLGSYGQIVHIIITRDGILNPTPTVSPTLTDTPRTTPTASPTP
jgi:cytoskeletal protein RodZ